MCDKSIEVVRTSRTIFALPKCASHPHVISTESTVIDMYYKLEFLRREPYKIR